MPLKSCMHPIDKIQGAEEEEPRKRKADPPQYIKTQYPKKNSQAPNNHNDKNMMKGAKKLKTFWTSNPHCNNNNVTNSIGRCYNPKKANKPKTTVCKFVSFYNFEVLKEQLHWCTVL